MIVMQPVLEISATADFELWAVGELPVDQVRGLVTGAQQDLRGFLALAGTWTGQHLPEHAAAVTAAVARALDLEPAP
ncbi:hypothetical protein [Streptomyces sp. NPDC001665]